MDLKYICRKLEEGTMKINDPSLFYRVSDTVLKIISYIYMLLSKQPKRQNILWNPFA